MNIEFTPQEAQFIYENIAQLNVPISNPNGATIHTVANSVLAKIKAEAATLTPEPDEPEPLASAAKAK